MNIRKPLFAFVASATTLFSTNGHATGDPLISPPYQTIIGEIQTLEGARDPKCYATATRLENFIYGTPLTDGARFGKINLQKALIYQVWRQAADQNASKEVSATAINQAIRQVLAYQQQDNGDFKLLVSAGSPITIAVNDQRHYSSIAYALRALLAVKQDMVMGLVPQLPPLDQTAVEALKQFIDLATLGALQLADQQARLHSQYELDLAQLQQAWQKVGQAFPLTYQHASNAQIVKSTGQPYQLLKQIVQQKVASYEAYNQISMTIFLRNLQVYFARHRWPKDPNEAKQFRSLFNEIMIQLSSDLILAAEREAKRQQHPTMQVGDVSRTAQQFMPHEINTYEDAIFFPNLAPEQQVTIESYDMDSFRDSGVHWKYIQWAIETPNFPGQREPDPFAAELLAENIAQFGVLLLRTAGDIGKARGDQALKASHLNLAAQQLQGKIQQHHQTQVAQHSKQTIKSSSSPQAKAQGDYFTDTTDHSQIDFMHRSSDWLNRLIRSFVLKSKNVGELAIPPAFGGSGVATEDIDGDGKTDILLLSGLGNRLYINQGDGTFADRTEAAGLNWQRRDGHPGEPRQPLIADFDNDGDQDIFITYVNDAHRLYLNNGKGQFTDISQQNNFGGKDEVAGPATTFDFNNDGLLDIYVANFGNYVKGQFPTLKRYNDNGTANRLYQNLGNMRFKEVTEGSGTANTGWGQALSHTDLDGDGWQDLIVGNDFGTNAYLKNEGDGRFTNIAKQIGTEKPSYTMNVGIADLNRDQFPDVYISNIVTMNKDEKYVTPGADTTMKFNPEKLGNMRVVEANDLFLSRTSGDQKLQGYELSNLVERGYSSTGWSWDADFFDFDNDGDDDLYVLNGMNEFNLYSSENPYFTDQNNEKQDVYIPVDTKESNVFFVNDGGQLNNESQVSGVNLLGNSRSAAYFDYDADGDLDIILNNYHGSAHLYQNNAEALKQNWLKIRLVGNPERQTNRDAIGARITVTAGDQLYVWREIRGSEGYLSVHPKQQHFGLGKHQQVNVSILWPNGDTAELKNVGINHEYVIVQGQEQISIKQQVSASAIARP